jgi:hypothetical protein
MPNADAPTLRVEPEKLKRIIAAYENAANRVYRILDDLHRRGRIQAPWTADRVSVEMTAHYNAQVFEGDYCTFAAVKRYESELRAVARNLRATLDSYEETEAEAVSAFQAPMRSTGGR